jgi:tetratricopeptide (TPR) repeat protein
VTGVGSDSPAPATTEERFQLGLRRVAGWLLLGLTVSLACVYTQWTEQPRLAVLWAFAFYASSFLIGFLFGIPKVLQSDAPAASGRSGLRINTNLEQVSDWLVKILVGLGLTELKQVPTHIYRAAAYVAPSLYLPAKAQLSTARIHAVGAIVVFFSILGFLTGYLVTRLLLGSLFRDADERTISHREQAELQEGTQAPADPELRPNMRMSAQAQSAANKIADLSITAAQREGIPPEALAAAKLSAGRFAEALECYEEAVRLAPADPGLRLKYAIALRQASRPVKESVRQLVEASSSASSAAASAELRLQIYVYLTFFALYLPRPESFEMALKYGEEYLKGSRPISSADLYLNMACAYGQRAQYNKSKGAPVDDDRLRAIEALKEMLALDPSKRMHARELLAPTPEQISAGENDLAVFRGDPAFEALLS